MKNILIQFKRFEVNLQGLKAKLGEDLYNISDISPEKITAEDVIYAIVEYRTKAISLQDLVNWVNIIWFTDLYEYTVKEENSIASVITLLETLDEDVVFTDKEYEKMISCLKKNIECNI